uniref:Uncharacterized protein n=1 Tax=Rhizophora mucronata TaxID=61149 RepID=A0A2P2KJF3_RHIMU
MIKKLTSSRLYSDFSPHLQLIP